MEEVPFNEVTDIKGAYSPDIKLMRNGKRKVIEIQPESIRSYYTSGDTVTINLYTPAAHFLQTDTMYLRARICFIDNSSMRADIAPAQPGDAYVTYANYPSMLGTADIHHTRSLFAPLYGTHTLIETLKVFSGSENYETIEHHNISQVIAHTMGNTAVARDTNYGYNCMDNVFPNPDYCYNVRGADKGFINVTSPGIQWAEVYIPFSCYLTHQPILPVHNLSAPLNISFKLAPAAEVFGCVVTPSRLESWMPSSAAVGNLIKRQNSVTFGLRFKTIDIEYYLSDITLVTDGLVMQDTSSLNLIPMDFPVLKCAVERSTPSASQTFSLPVQTQKPSMRYLALAAIRTEAFTRIMATTTDANGIIACATDALSLTSAATPVVADRVSPINIYDENKIHDSNLNEYSIYGFHELPITRCSATLGGSEVVEGLQEIAYSPRNRYTELDKEFHGFASSSEVSGQLYPFSKVRAIDLNGFIRKDFIYQINAEGNGLIFLTANRTDYGGGLATYDRMFEDNMALIGNDRFASFALQDTDRDGSIVGQDGFWGGHDRAQKHIWFVNFSRIIGESSDMIQGKNTNMVRPILRADLAYPWDTNWDAFVFCYYNTIMSMDPLTGNFVEYN